MNFSNRRNIALLFGALATASVGATSAARADNIFDRIFGGHRGERQFQGQFPDAPSPRQQRRAPISVPKVSSPQYYTYKPQSLSRVDFAPVLAAVKAQTFPAATLDLAFHDAMVEMGDYDLYAEPDIAKAIAKHYAGRPKFIWVSGDRPNARARAALDMLGDAASYGLDDADYTVALAGSDFASDDAVTRLEKLARFEMSLTARVLRYAKDASIGRVIPDKLSGYHDLPEKPFDAGKVLASLENAGDVRAFLEAQHPGNEKYKALRADLADLRASSEKEIVVAPDTLVHPGESDADFAKLLKIIERDADSSFLEEYGDTLAMHDGDETYGNDLVPVIKAAQKAHGLNTDGVVGPRTVAALAGQSKSARIEKVLMSLERLRWLPSDLGDPRVVINASSFGVTYTQGGEDKLSMRVVVGRTTNQTSFFYDKIEYVEFNPYWGVPKSIIINEMLPKLLQDPGYLDRAGYEVTNAKGQRIPSASIDWGRYGADIPFDVRQLPSEANALGELKIMFPNKHAIYMHDTPQKSYFKRDTRAFSHGCVRLQHPREMAAEVLGWPVDRVASRIAQGHNKAEVDRDIPVYVGYFTAWPDDAGKVSYSGDIYDRDTHLKAALDKVRDTRAPAS